MSAAVAGVSVDIRNMNLIEMQDVRTGNSKTGNIVLIGKSETELLGVVVDLLNILKLQANEALVTTSESLVGSGRGASRDVLFLVLGCGLTEGGALVGLAMLSGW